MLELQLRRSLCCETEEGPDNEDTVTEVEFAPAEDEDGGA